MWMKRQDDGTYATTHVLIGCVKDNACVHCWTDFGMPREIAEKILLQPQRCTLCKCAVRSRVVGEPSDIEEYLKQCNEQSSSDS